MIIQEYVDQEILVKRIEILENTLNSIDMDELLDEAFDINTSLYLYEATSNSEAIKMTMESMKAAKAEIKIANQCKKDNNIKEAIIHLDKADKLLLQTDKKLRDIDDFSDTSVFLGALIYTMISTVKSLLFLVPAFIVRSVGVKKLQKDIEDVNKNTLSSINKTMASVNIEDMINDPLNAMNNVQNVINNSLDSQKAMDNIRNKTNKINIATKVTAWSGVIAGIGRLLGELKHFRKVVQNNGDQKSLNLIVVTLRNSIDNTRKIISKIKSNYR